MNAKEYILDNSRNHSTQHDIGEDYSYKDNFIDREKVILTFLISNTNVSSKLNTEVKVLQIVYTGYNVYVFNIRSKHLISTVW